MVRDGGSLTADLRAGGLVYRLWFGIVLRHGANSFERLGFKEPVVGIRVDWRTTESIGWSIEDERPLAWEQAESLLLGVRHLTGEFDERNATLYEAMLFAAEQHGQLDPALFGGGQ